MDSTIPKPLQDAMEAFKGLPGVGSRSAERFAYYLFKASPDKSAALVDSLKDLHKKIRFCPKTFALIESNEEMGHLYTDPKRNKKIVAVVADPFDIMAIEKTNSFKGTYHVLGGLLSPIDNVSPENLRISELVKRLDDDSVDEVILATNASVEGENTALFITQAIGKRSVRVTRLARGLPVGLDLEYADQITLTRALEGRQTI